MELVVLIAIGIAVAVAIAKSNEKKLQQRKSWLITPIPETPKAGCGLLIAAGLTILTLAGLVMASL
jgi:hypothetical protein